MGKSWLCSIKKDNFPAIEVVGMRKTLSEIIDQTTDETESVWMHYKRSSEGDRLWRSNAPALKTW
ncbi:GM11094 [Drosophila sechellia]|uniref:GM11094 n=1 Tax=Drosophila sechellia TaxID=7238 RepID=B4ILK6_DROSE|nr:GM11094 [Drosophila sechellia]